MTERDGVWKQIIPHNPRGLTWSSALKEWNKDKKKHADSKLSQSISRTLCSDGLPSRLQWTGDPITHTFFSPPASDYQWCMQTCTMTPPMVPAHFLCISNHHSYQITGMLQLVIVPQLIKDGNSGFFLCSLADKKGLFITALSAFDHGCSHLILLAWGDKCGLS